MLKTKGDHHMGFGTWKEVIPSDKSKQFEEGQKVSFIYRKEIRSGIITVLLINSAVINIIDSSKPKNKKEKTVISYEKLLSMYQ
ncbi:hypothetical protein C3915_RS12430 [Enterococcus faecalis]|uniref:hypothetical protein n=1 Tax=Enterococcus faecalis TaxID=1351 RepID=UPI0013E94012|nr:hypothetical protein [Enterococcus faecalis]EHU5025962.1 hypothetical protein [Enterococcus faecalis]